MRQPLRATRDRAATLARLTQEARQQLATRGERGQQQPVVVKILAAIPAGDYQQKDAMLMSLDGGVLTPTNQLVKVRHVGSSAVSVDTLVTPEPCGTLGLCFVRDVQVVRLAVGARLVTAVGPQSAAIGTENTDWSFGPFSGHPWSQATSGYYAACDFGSPSSTSPPDIRPKWVMRMKPFRWKAWGYGESYYGGVRMKATPSTTRPAVPVEQWMFGNAGYGTGQSLVPLQPQLSETHHLSPVISNLVTMPHGFRFTRYPRLFPLGRTEVVQDITHFRIWIDGVDKTGIKTGPLLQHSLEPLDYAGKQIEYDIWVRYTVYDDGYPEDAVKQIGWVDHRANCEPLTTQGVTSYPADYSTAQFQFDFDSYGPESLTSLTTVTDNQPGWVHVNWPDVNDVGVRKTGVGRLVFEYQYPEIPLIKYYRESTPFQTYNYAPVDNSKYQPLRFENGSSLTVGTYATSSPVVFKLIGATRNTSAFPYGIRDYKGSGGLASLDDIYTDVPQNITLTKIA